MSIFYRPNELLRDHRSVKIIDEKISDKNHYDIEDNKSDYVAQGMAQYQNRYWSNLSQSLTDNNLGNYIKNIIETSRNGRIALVKKMSPTLSRVESELPIIIEDISTDDLTILSNDTPLAAAAIKLKILALRADTVLHDIFRLDPLMIQLISEYSMQRSLLKSQNETSDYNDQVVRSAAFANKQAEAAAASAELSVILLRENKEEILETSRTLKIDLEKWQDEIILHKDNAQLRIQELSHQAAVEITKISEAQKALISLAPTVQLWNKKSRKHIVSFSISFFVFVSIIIGFTSYTYVYGITEITRAASIANGNSLILSILLVVPILSVAWILRMISKFANLHLSLYDDATQRKAIAATYIGLLSETPQGIDEKERAVALQALFRPASNPPVESDIGPPSILEIFTKRG